MSYLRPPSPYETGAPVAKPPAPAGPRLDIGRVIGRSFAVIGQRWRGIGLFIVAYFAIDWAFRIFVPLHYQDGRHDVQLALSIASYLGFECLRWFRDTALTVTALQPASPLSARWSILEITKVSLRAFPTLLPFFVFFDLPFLAETFWNAWFGSMVRLPTGRLLELTLAITLVQVVYLLFVTGCWGVTVPVVAAEAGGLAQAMRRAWRLLSGSRWRFSAIYLVVIVIVALPEMLASALAIPVLEGLRYTGHAADYFRTELAIAGALGSIIAATWRVMIAVAYLELRRVREGVVLGDVVEVFA